jgi:mannosyl-oligosaccharide glucosidase
VLFAVDVSDDRNDLLNPSTMQLQWLLLLPVLPAALALKDGNDTDTLLWGAYRPNLYFGLRPRIPESLMTGLMWFGTQDYQSFGSTYIFRSI